MPKVTRTHSRTNAPRAPRPAPTEAHTGAADPAAALIARAVGAAYDGHRLSEDAIEALRKIFAHNDACARSGSGRVSRGAAAQMLRESFAWAGGEHALESACRRVFGRKSWGSP